MKIRLLDVMAVVLVAAAVFLSSIMVYGGTGETLSVIIESGDGKRIYPLDETRTVSVPGPLGETDIVIAKNRVQISESPCNNKTCILAGSIGTPGSWVACLPNKVFVSVSGKKNAEGIDARAW